MDYQSTIAQKYFGGQVDLSSQKNLDKLMEELSAYIAGDIHEGTNEAYLRPLLRDYDAAKTARETLIRSARKANPTGDGDSLMQEIRRLYDENSDAPETLPESEDAFLRGFQDDGDGPGRLGQLRILDGSGSIPLWKSAGNTGPTKPGVPAQIGTVDFSDSSAVRSALDRAQEAAAELNYEVSCSVTADGKVWLVSGEGSVVDSSAIPSSLAGSYSYHNHPAAKTWFSFSAEDVRFFFESGEAYAKASDQLYEYTMERTPDTLAVSPELVYHRFKEIEMTSVLEMKWEGTIDPDLDGYHEVMKILSRELKFIYERTKKEDK